MRGSSADEARFWGHATAFGATWGALEATVGSFLHALKVPFTGVALAGCGAALLVALRVVYPERGVILASAAVCAGVKLLSPATAVLGPMTGIIVEGALVEMVCAIGGPGVAAASLGGALATSWALLQKVLVQVLLYGAPVLDLYRELLRRAEGWLGLPSAGGAWVAGPFAALVAALGAALGLAGRRAGLTVRQRRGLT